MEISNLIPHIEALIFASDKPLTAPEITELVNQAFGFMEDKIEVEQVDASLEGIVEKYNSEFYPFEVKQSGGGWQFLTKKDFHKTVAQLNGEKFLKRLSAAALETLAIVAYKQPVTKGEIEAIRGVSSDYAVQKLLEKELIVISGRNEKLPGHPLVYATSKNFMDYFGINSPEDLPKIKEVLADQVIEPTVINHTDFEQSEVLAVTDTGELIGDVIPGSTTAEEHVNGHSFEMGAELNAADEEVTEDAPTEEAIEEFITDEIFIEGDEEEAEEAIEEELTEEGSPETPGTEDDESFSDEDDDANADEEKDKP
ncbi:MAG TPA: SMC-Scp complex subunit ScpB [Flavisolibacter sp.]|jgi:segregation and condensation protein B|nr:SMC-Scp complex subunit ScpB [Flavisolibacter sp.]